MHHISAKRLASLDTVDRMPAELRECVHEFGYPIVSVLVSNGVTKPSVIREIVRECWLGARQDRQTQGALSTLDSILAINQPISAVTLIRYLASNNMTIVRTDPTAAMLEASMNEVSGHNLRCTKREKHRRRLSAALSAAKDEMLDRYRAR